MKSIIILVTLFMITYAYPNGAPLRACGSMIPSHKGSPSSDSPFYIKVDRNQDSSFNVTITSDSQDEFKGYLCQARADFQNEDTVFGKWDLYGDSLTKTIDCFDKSRSAVTHSSKKKQTELTFKWSSDSTNDSKVTFICTIVQKYSIYYVGVTKTVDLTQ